MRMSGTRLNEMNAGIAHERIKNRFFCFYLGRAVTKKELPFGNSFFVNYLCSP